MTGKNAVKTSSTEDDETPIAKIQASGAISIPKAMKGNEDAYAIERDEHGRFVLTPLKIEESVETLVQTND